MNKHDIELILMGYKECALWLVDEEDKCCDLSPQAHAQMREQVEEFCTSYLGLVEQYMGRGLDLEQFGHDLWLTRNRHGAGFWDRGLGTLGQLLSNAARDEGGVDLYVGRDGLLWLE